MQLQLIKCVFTPTGTYHQQVRRAYTTSGMGAQAIGKMAEVTAYGNNLTPAAVATAVGGILMPSAAPEANINIHNGWQEQRFHFLLEFAMVVPGLASSFRKIITGFTDKMDLSMNGLMDPYMLMRINNHMTVKDMRLNGYVQTQVVDNDLVIIGDHSPSMYRSNEFSLRPTDVLGSVQTSGTVLGFQDAGDETIVDTRMQFAGGIKHSRRTNNLASTYMSRLMTGYREAVSMAQDDDNMQAVHAVGSAVVNERSVSDDPFYFSLMDNTDFLRSGYFTWGDLLHKFPDIDAKTVIHRMTTQYGGQQLTSAMDSQHWAGANHETVMATVIMNGVPAIMMECMFAYFSFMVTNMTPDGRPDVFFNQEPAMLVDGIDANMFLESFRTKLLHTVAPLLSRDNMVGYSIQVNCDVYHDMAIMVSVENQPPVPFVAPLFADSMLAPVISGDVHRVRDLTYDIGTILTTLDGGHSPAPVTDFASSFSAPTGAGNGYSKFL